MLFVCLSGDIVFMEQVEQANSISMKVCFRNIRQKCYVKRGSLLIFNLPAYIVILAQAWLTWLRHLSHTFLAFDLGT